MSTTNVKIDSLEMLKNSIAIYHLVTGGNSAQLCGKLMKLPDFIDMDIDQVNRNEEMATMSINMLREIAMGISARIESIKNTTEPLKAAKYLLDFYGGPTGGTEIIADFHHTYKSLLVLIDNALRALQTETHLGYPSIKEFMI